MLPDLSRRRGIVSRSIVLAIALIATFVTVTVVTPMVAGGKGSLSEVLGMYEAKKVFLPEYALQVYSKYGRTNPDVVKVLVGLAAVAVASENKALYGQLVYEHEDIFYRANLRKYFRVLSSLSKSFGEGGATGIGVTELKQLEYACSQWESGGGVGNYGSTSYDPELYYEAFVGTGAQGSATTSTLPVNFLAPTTVSKILYQNKEKLIALFGTLPDHVEVCAECWKYVEAATSSGATDALDRARENLCAENCKMVCENYLSWVRSLESEEEKMKTEIGELSNCISCLDAATGISGGGSCSCGLYDLLTHSIFQ